MKKVMQVVPVPKMEGKKMLLNKILINSKIFDKNNIISMRP